jgi:hypothetical protein
MFLDLLVIDSIGIIGCLVSWCVPIYLLGWGLIFQVMLHILPVYAIFLRTINAWSRAGSYRNLLATAALVGGGSFVATTSFLSLSRSLGTRITNAVEELNSGSDQIDAAAHQVAQSSQILAQGMSEQASTIHSISTTPTILSNELSKAPALLNLLQIQPKN